MRNTESLTDDHPILNIFNGQHLPDYDPNDYIDDTELNLNPATYPKFGNYTFQKMNIKKLANKSQEFQMKFSDAITRRYAKNQIFLDQMRQHPIASFINDIEINETVIGNTVFMAYHNPNNEFFQSEYQILLTYCRNL